MTKKIKKKKSCSKSKAPKIKVKSAVKKISTSSRALEPKHFHNRELSWLQFNERVLYMASDIRTPLLERLRFLNIFINNLDEFYMKRIGGLKDQIATKQVTISIDNLTTAEQLVLIRKKIKDQLEVFQTYLEKNIEPELQEQNITLLKWNELTDKEKSSLKNIFLLKFSQPLHLLP